MLRKGAGIASFLVFFLVCNTSMVWGGVKKIAVLDFEDNTASSATPDFEDNPMAALALLTGRAPAQQDKTKVGKAVANILVTELVKDGTYKVVERSQLEKVLSEQKMGQSGVLSATEAARLGKLLGVSAVVLGSVTEYNTKSETKGVLGVGVKTKTAKVAVNSRIVDTATAEILFAAEGVGAEEDSNVQVGAVYGSGSSNIQEALLSAATKKAMANVLQQLKDNSMKMKDVVLEGAVAYVDTKAKSILVDLGSEHGLQQGQPLYVVRVDKEIKNSSGEVIKRISKTVGELRIVELDKKAATCACIAGDCVAIKENDRVSTEK